MDRFEGILQQAAERRPGVAVLCTSAQNADVLRRQLYVKRAKAQERGETAYDDLSISFSPHAGDILFVYRKAKDNGEI